MSRQAAAIDDADLRGRRPSYTRLPAPHARSYTSFAAVQRVGGFGLRPVIGGLFSPESLGAGASLDLPWGFYAVRRDGRRSV